MHYPTIIGFAAAMLATGSSAAAQTADMHDAVEVDHAEASIQAEIADYQEHDHSTAADRAADRDAIEMLHLPGREVFDGMVGMSHIDPQRFKIVHIGGVSGFFFARSDFLDLSPAGLLRAVTNPDYGPRNAGADLNARRGTTYTVIFDCGGQWKFKSINIADTLAQQQETITCP